MRPWATAEVQVTVAASVSHVEVAISLSKWPLAQAPAGTGAVELPAAAQPVGDEPMRDPQGQVLAFDSFNQAYDIAQQVNVRRADRSLACPECNRLREQARAAVLICGLRSRLLRLGCEDRVRIPPGGVPACSS